MIHDNMPNHHARLNKHVHICMYKFIIYVPLREMRYSL